MINLMRRDVLDDCEILRVLGMTVYRRVGLVSVATIFGWDFYKRIDSVRSLFGIVWGGRHAA